jgi:hypothetical protein
MRLRESPQLRSPAHLKWVRGHECSIAAKHDCIGKIQAAHVRTGTDGGTGKKPSDNYTIPLCIRAHSEQHLMGESAFERKYQFSMLAMAHELWLRSPARRRLA